jgi:hypothetical protein
MRNFILVMLQSHPFLVEGRNIEINLYSEEFKAMEKKNREAVALSFVDLIGKGS